MNRIPRVRGPQWLATVQPAVVRLISTKSAYSLTRLSTSFTISSGVEVQVIKIRSKRMSSRPSSLSLIYERRQRSHEPRYFLTTFILPSMTSMLGWS